MSSTLWTDSYLDRMRLEGDPLADEVVARLYAEHQISAVNTLMKMLVENEGVPSTRLPPLVAEYLEKSAAAVPVMDLAKIRRGEEVFQAYGPEILMVLAFYSLPLSYAAKKGVQVLHRTAYLAKRPIRRAFETMQMVVDVMGGHGLEPGGAGLRTAQKVRLMHAAVRHLIQNDKERPWDTADLGVPINQEDLAGTLSTFTYVVFEGLARCGIHLSDEEQDAYLHAWQAVGRVMGVRPELIPATMAEAKELAVIIRRRQFAPSREGQEMTAALLDGIKALYPPLLEGMPASLAHFFLDHDVGDDNLAELLGVPEADWTLMIPKALSHLGGLIHWLGESREVGEIARFFGYGFAEVLLLVERGGQRAPFRIPESLQDGWKLRRAKAKAS